MMPNVRLLARAGLANIQEGMAPANRWIWVRRACFVVLLVTQTCILSAKHLTVYSRFMGFIAFSVVPVIVAWAIILYHNEDQLEKLWVVWAIYAIEMVVILGVLAGTEIIAQSPNSLKITFCMAPAIALVLITTASDFLDYPIVVYKLCAGMVIHLLDASDALAIIVDSEHPTGSVSTSALPKSLKIVIIICIALTLLLLTLLMAETKSRDKILKTNKARKRTHFWNQLCMAVLNAVLCIVRLIAWLDYENASIFVVKNIIVVWVSFTTILKIQKCCGFEDEEENDNNNNDWILSC